MFRRLLCALVAVISLATPTANAGQLPRAKVTLGDEIFLQSAWHDLHGKCVGVITNQTGVTSHLVNIVDAIKANPGICLKAIYSPEHGLRGDRAAGAYVSSYTDPRTGLPVYSLYGPQKHPSAKMLAGVDVLLFDIQDVGDRPYTYVSTMAYAMEAAKEFGKEIWVLDRPNPIGGDGVEGPVLDPRFKSFIGLYPIPMRHGMTVGELADLFNSEYGIGAKLRVIRMEGWHRDMLWPDTGLQWVQTSPNIPEWSTAVVYPGTGLIDNAGLNGGIGTTKPFKYAGTVGLDAYRLAGVLNAKALPGVYFRPAYWSPFFGSLKEQQLGGVELVVYDPRVFPSVRAGVEILTAVRDIAPSAIKIDAKALDIDWGTDSLRLGLKDGESAAALEDAWQPAVDRFKTIRAKYLLYN
ncbi:MAG: exo-beta-N-acetylmuramidase NamZ family protein [Vulcanimicrobiaceae bacterium]